LQLYFVEKNREITMQVKEIMNKNVITVTRSTTLRELLTKFASFHKFPVVPVIDEERKLIGMVYLRNIIDVFSVVKPHISKAIAFYEEEEEDIFNIQLDEGAGSLILVDDIMDTKYFYLHEDATIEEAYKDMKMYQKDELPVVDKEGRLAGIVGIFDIILAVFRQNKII